MATSDEGVSRKVTAQVCEVNKGLMSVHKLVEKGKPSSLQEAWKLHRRRKDRRKNAPARKKRHMVADGMDTDRRS